MRIQLALVFPVLAGLAPAAGLAADVVDIELVLAVDLSGSVDSGEQTLQRDGLAAAFRDADVTAAITSLPQGVAVALVGWAGAGEEQTLVGWRRLDGQRSAEAFASQIEAVRSGAGIGVLHDYAARLYDDLVPVLPGLSVTRSYWIVVHDDVRGLARVRAAHDVIVALVEKRRRDFL